MRLSMIVAKCAKLQSLPACLEVRLIVSQSLPVTIDDVDAGATSVRISLNGRLVGGSPLNTVVCVWDIQTDWLVVRQHGQYL